MASYLNEWRNTQPFHSGDDLMNLGIPGGPGMRDFLRTLRAARIDGTVKSMDEERGLIGKLRDDEAKHG